MRVGGLPRLLAAAAALLVVALAPLGPGEAAQAVASARAATAADVLRAFDPADIISDAVMFNPSTMSTAAVQSFLNGKVPTCRSGATCLKDYHQDTGSKAADPMCDAYTGAKDESAATIIVRVARACGVNPQVLLVTLQKEQGLVLDSYPGARQYRSATGYGCPDTAPCDSDYYGFFNQVYKAAWAFKRYTSPKGTEGAGWTKYNWFPVGRPSGVLYNPSAACGARTITIQNKATAVLYYFTPYQPNAAALAAGFGTGDGCSAYGNRNFFLYFTTWFGSTHYAVTGAVASYWRSKGGAKGTLGDPLQNAVDSTAAGGGIVQRFSGGTVYSSTEGTFAVQGASASAYAAAGGPGGSLGWPKKEPAARKANGGGSVQAFEHGSVYVSEAGAFAVAGGVYNRFGKAGYEAGDLGWPTGVAVRSDAAGGGAQQAFTGGRVVVTDRASTIVTGKVLTKWLQRGGESGSLGWPTGEAARSTARGRTGTVQAFTTGRVILLGSKTYTVTGDVSRNWVSHGAQAGSLGWPTAAAAHSTANGGGWSQRFTGGAVLWSAASGAHLLTGKELALYDRRGGTAGTLGWPGARTRTSVHGGGAVTAFTNGNIYSSRSGAVAVLGDILVKYLAKDGPAGRLGWPVASAKGEHGATVQHFEHGRISWTAATGAVASSRP